MRPVGSTSFFECDSPSPEQPNEPEKVTATRWKTYLGWLYLNERG
jgi:hypothetical protein